MFGHFTLAGLRARPSDGSQRKAVRSRVRSLHPESLEQRQLLTASVSSLADIVATPMYEQIVSSTLGNVSPLATSSPTGLTPAQVRHAYGVDQITFNNGTVAGDGTGQTIAIVDAYNDPNIASDLHQFDLKFGLSDPVLTKVNQTGGSTMPKGDTNWSAEISLDVEWAHAIAPKANILLVEANSSSLNDLLTAVNYARNAPGVVAVSMSWGAGEFSGEQTLDSYFTTPAGHAGVSFFVSAGDSGSPAEYPSASPNVVSVGGTTLNVNSAGAYLSEGTWQAGGGGTSTQESTPSYQSGLSTGGRRGTPDVSYDANPGTGFPVYDSYGTSAPWAQYGGTSAGAPQWAALVAIADQGRALAGKTALDGGTQLLPALYALSSADFHDITSGSTVSSSGTGPTINAVTGYDLASGRGTPVANRLVADLVGSGTSTAPAPAAATHFSISTVGTDTAGTSFSYVVTALDASNKVVTGYTGSVHFASSDAGSTLPADYTFTAGDAGQHTFTVRLVTAGSQTVSATDKASSSISTAASVSVSPAAANHLLIVQQPGSALVNSVLSTPFIVRVYDAYNNPLTNDNTDQITLSLGSNPGGAALGGTTTATVSGGVVTFSNLSLNVAGSGYSIVAQLGSLPSVTSSAFNITAAATSSAATIEDFESGNLSAYKTVGSGTSASVSTSAAHDGTYGLLDSNGGDWVYRNDTGDQVKRGDTVSVWLQFSSAADGRAYFGFGASSAGSLSLVAAPNTGQLILQSNSNYGYTDLASSSQTYQPNHWYRLEVSWGTSGTVIGKIYDSNGTTLLNSVTATGTTVTSGGIAFRAFGSAKDWDTVTLNPGVNAFNVSAASTALLTDVSAATGGLSSGSPFGGATLGTIGAGLAAGTIPSGSIAMTAPWQAIFGGGSTLRTTTVGGSSLASTASSASLQQAVWHEAGVHELLGESGLEHMASELAALLTAPV